MLELDFAYFSLINIEKKGLAAKEPFLKMLTPIFFRPRLERLIEIRDIRTKGCNIMVPLGMQNFNSLPKGLREDLVANSLNIIKEYDIHYMAVDRNLKAVMQDLTAELPAVFGDDFIKALANEIIAATLDKYGGEKIILVGEIEGMEGFAEVCTNYGLPLSLQSYNPHAWELMSYRLLYEKGCAVSNSYINPGEWERGDIIVNFAGEPGRLEIGSPSLCYFGFDNQQINVAPALEASLRKSGITPGIHSLAPILETCLLRKAGFPKGNAENLEANTSGGKSFLHLQEIGEQMGIWELFLDKGFQGLYNTF